MRWILLAAFLPLCGCVNFSAMSSETRITEFAWQAVNAADALQTREIAASDGCYREHGIARGLIGEYPSQAEVAGWWALTAWGHAAVTSAMSEHDADPWLIRAWQWVTLGVSADTVRGNYQLGIRIGGNHKYGPNNPCR